MDNLNDIKENVYKTICPGCSVGCGVYIRQLRLNDENINLGIDYRKVDPINEGKLCYFGVHLSKYYNQHCISNLNDKLITDQKDRIEYIKNIFKTYKSNEIEFINLGNSTNEEHLAFMDLANIVNCSVNTINRDLYQDMKKLHCLIQKNIKYSEIINYNKIYVFCDLSVQYPLLVRYLLKAKKNGSEIISVGIKSFSFDTKHISIDINKSLYDLKEFCPDENSLIISDVNNYTDKKRLAEILEFSNNKGSKILLMKPFVNSVGINSLSKHTNQKSINEIYDLIEKGIVKVLVCLESDIVGLSFDQKVVDTLKKLKELVVITSLNNKTEELATVSLIIDPFYMRYGTIVNSEKRLINQYNITNKSDKNNYSFNLIQDIIEGLGGKKTLIDDMKLRVFETFNLKLDSNKDTSFISKDSKNLQIPLNYNVSSDISFSKNINKKEDMLVHIYSLSPCYCNSLDKYNDFIEISNSQVHSLDIQKNNIITILCECGDTSKKSKYKISNIMDGYVCSWNKKNFAKEYLSYIKIEK